MSKAGSKSFRCWTLPCTLTKKLTHPQKEYTLDTTHSFKTCGKILTVGKGNLNRAKRFLSRQEGILNAQADILSGKVGILSEQADILSGKVGILNKKADILSGKAGILSEQVSHLPGAEEMLREKKKFQRNKMVFQTGAKTFR